MVKTSGGGATATSEQKAVGDDILDELAQVLAAPEFSGYASVVEDARGRILTDLVLVEVDITSAQQEVEEANRRLRLAQRWNVVWIAVQVAVVTAFLATGLSIVMGPWSASAWAGVVPGVVPAAFVYVRFVLDPKRDEGAADARTAARDARSRYEERRRQLVEEVVRHHINKQLEQAVEFPFSAEAPSLVELDSARIVPARALDNVKEFVRTHDASAIGISGPRGIGKSTVLRELVSVTSEPFFARALSVYVTAPVRYEPVALLRHIFEEVVLAGLGSVDATRARALTRGQGVGRLRLMAGLAMAYGGVLVYWWGRDHELHMEPLQIAGLVVAVAGFGLALQGYVSLLGSLWRRHRRIPWSARPAETNAAIEVLEDGFALLHWQVERATTSALTLKVLSGQIESGDSTTHTEREYERTRPEVAAAFRRLVRDYLTTSKRHDHLVVCIDELDKLTDPADVVAVINELKDLMHTRGMHMVVSVSTDAMHSFALRGVPVRDVFDSTFDEIVMAERLTAEESVSVLQARVAGFPRPLSAFCHAWSGGVPRDLIRAARACRDVQRSPHWGGSLGELASGVVKNDVNAAVHAYVTRSGLRVRLTDRGLEEVAALLDSARPQGYERLSGVIADVGADVGVDRIELRAVSRYLEIAGQVVEVFALDLDYGEWLALDESGALAADATRLADAMRSLSEGIVST